MIIDAISNGIVIDHISAGKAMYLYNILGLDQLDCSVALLKNVVSSKLGPAALAAGQRAPFFRCGRHRSG